MTNWNNNRPQRHNFALGVISLSLWLGSGTVLGADNPRGVVYVAPRAQHFGYPGHAVKLLRGSFRLKDIHNPTPITDFPSNARGVVLTAEDLANPAIAKFIQHAYAAGLTVAMVEADDENAEHLRVLVGRALPILLADETSNSPTVPLVAVREDVAENCCRTHRLHRTHILGERSFQGNFEMRNPILAERREAQWLKAVFTKWPEAPRPNAESPSNDLTELANSTLTDKVQSISNGTVLQLVNHTWAARSFLSDVDYYYVQQWLTLRNPNISFIPFDHLKSNNILLTPVVDPVTIQFGPGNTERATTYSSGVNYSIGGVAGYNKGAIATVNAGMTISNSTTTTVQRTNITYEGNPQNGVTRWKYITAANDNDTLANKTFAYTQNWIWAVPLGAYQSEESLVYSTYAEGQPSLLFYRDSPVVSIMLSSSVPQPFNHTTLAPPTVASVSKPTAKPGDVITVFGTNFYLINGVLIGGTQVPAANYEVVESNTKLKIVIPGNQPTGDNQSIVINTQEGLSNADVTIWIQ